MDDSGIFTGARDDPGVVRLKFSEGAFSRTYNCNVHSTWPKISPLPSGLVASCPAVTQWLSSRVQEFEIGSLFYVLLSVSLFFRECALNKAGYGTHRSLAEPSGTEGVKRLFSSEVKIVRPSVLPRSSEDLRSGWGIIPTTLPAMFEMAAISCMDPLGFI